MYHLISVIAIVTLFSTTASGKLKKLETEYFHVEYEEEAEEYVLASLKVLEFVRSQAINNGFYLPGKIKFSVIRSERNVLYFDYKRLKGITWEYNSMTNFLPPEESRKKNVYGLCHELGHLCMFHTTSNRNNWMSREYREAWADFFGHFMIDSVYQFLGTDFWPEAHNYLETAGMEFFVKRLQQKKEIDQLDEFDFSSLYWYELNGKVGFRNLCRFFQELDKQKVNNPEAREKYLDVLKTTINDPDLSTWYDQYAGYLILNSP